LAAYSKIYRTQVGQSTSPPSDVKHQLGGHKVKVIITLQEHGKPCAMRFQQGMRFAHAAAKDSARQETPMV
jgi:hypothetical protein